MQLGRLLARADNAPLLGSYRALAEAPAMRGDASVDQLLDSLVEIERERESYNAVGASIPYSWRSLRGRTSSGAPSREWPSRDAPSLRQEIAALAPPRPRRRTPWRRAPVPDTLERHCPCIRRSRRRRGSGEPPCPRAGGAAHAWTRAKGRARELANLGASPPAMLAAALIFGAVIGFGFALVDEIRHPRIADAYEAERATGVRVLGVISPLPQSPERGRRSSDRNAPPYIDPGADGHQLIYLHIATAGSNVLMLTVTGDNPAVSAVVGDQLRRDRRG